MLLIIMMVFGTSEMVVGIRAYQWGWEYYYPKDLDLNYVQRPSYSSFIGNSLRYESVSSIKNQRAYHWKHLLSHLNQRASNAPSMLWLHSDRFNLLPLLAPQVPLWTPLRNTAAFNQARQFSKFTPYEIFTTEASSCSPFNSHMADRFSPFFYENSGIVTTVPIYNLLSTTNLRHSVEHGIDFTSTNRLILNWFPFRLTTIFPVFSNIITPLSIYSSKHPTNYLFMSRPSTFHYGPQFMAFYEGTSLLSTERVGRVILNFGEKTPLWNQSIRNWSSSPFKPTYTSFLPSLLNQTRFFNRNSSPLPTNSVYGSPSFHDEESDLNPSGVPTILLNKEELLPDWSIVHYNANSQLNTTAAWLPYLLKSRVTFHHLAPLLPFVPYNEYDFLNWQAYDLWESAFWDYNQGNSFFEESVLSLDTFFDFFVKFRTTRPYTWLARDHRTKKIPYSYIGGGNNLLRSYLIPPHFYHLLSTLTYLTLLFKPILIWVWMF